MVLTASPTDQALAKTNRAQSQTPLTPLHRLHGSLPYSPALLCSIVFCSISIDLRSYSFNYLFILYVCLLAFPAYVWFGVHLLPLFACPCAPSSTCPVPLPPPHAPRARPSCYLAQLPLLTPSTWTLRQRESRIQLKVLSLLVLCIQSLHSLQGHEFCEAHHWLRGELARLQLLLGGVQGHNGVLQGLYGVAKTAKGMPR